MTLLQLTLLPLWDGGVFRLVLPRCALSFPDSVSSGKDSRKVPRKSIQYYLEMYPRINRQVSSITLPSILASFFRRPCRRPARSVVGLGAQACLWRKGVKSYRTARTFPRLFPQSTDARAYEHAGQETRGIPALVLCSVAITLACSRADLDVRQRGRNFGASFPLRSLNHHLGLQPS